MVLLSMGGAGWDYGRLDELGSQDRAWIVVPGGGRTARRRGRLLVLPFHGGFYHPDLVAASDIVVGKLGYSTVAEAFHAGSAFAYVARPNFPESPVLATFVKQHMAAMEIEESAFRCGSWLQQIEPLLAVPRKRFKMANGAEAAANAILDLLSI
jgi:UDP-N-acetylglucosamine:LPS N-acetylglucosamine transferase